MKNAIIIPLVSLLLISCTPMALTGKKQTPFWMLAVVPQSNPQAGSVGTASSGNPASGSFGTPSGANTGNPVEGMYFFHNDHLNSVAMVTDASGRMVSGMDVDTGASHVSYMPYGEVNKTNSDGPDIFRYKYTGQEEDQETGLYYYKARYYDPVIGRFIQPDTFTDSMQAMGMNQYMYVLGNPVNFNDPSGHCWKRSLTFAPWPVDMGGGIQGNYGGNGSCDKHRLLPSQDQNKSRILYYLLADQAGSGEFKQLFLIMFIFENFINPMPPRTETDKGSQIHDRDGSGFTRSTSMQANNKWMRHASSLWVGGGLLGPIPTRKMINNTWERESHYLNKKHTFWGKPRGVYGDATNLVTNIKFGMQIMQEYKATLYGYALFGTANAVNQVLMFNGDFYSDASKTVGKARHRFVKNIDDGLDGLEKSRSKLNKEISRQIKPPSILKTAFKIRVRL